MASKVFGSMTRSLAVSWTVAEAERVLVDLGQVEIAIAQMKAALW